MSSGVHILVNFRKFLLLQSIFLIGGFSAHGVSCENAVLRAPTGAVVLSPESFVEKVMDLPTGQSMTVTLRDASFAADKIALHIKNFNTPANQYSIWIGLNGPTEVKRFVQKVFGEEDLGNFYSKGYSLSELKSGVGFETIKEELHLGVGIDETVGLRVNLMNSKQLVAEHLHRLATVWTLRLDPDPYDLSTYAGILDWMQTAQPVTWKTKLAAELGSGSIDRHKDIFRINEHLREVKDIPPEMADYIRSIDEVVEGLYVHRDLLVFRALSGSSDLVPIWTQLMEGAKGRVLTQDPGFAFGTMDLRIAEYWHQYKTSSLSGDKVILEIKVRSGSKLTLIDGAAGTNGRRGFLEVLFPRQAQFRAIGARLSERGSRILTVEYLSEGRENLDFTSFAAENPSFSGNNRAVELGDQVLTLELPPAGSSRRNNWETYKLEAWKEKFLDTDGFIDTNNLPTQIAMASKVKGLEELWDQNSLVWDTQSPDTPYLTHRQLARDILNTLENIEHSFDYSPHERATGINVRRLIRAVVPLFRLGLNEALADKRPHLFHLYNAKIATKILASLGFSGREIRLARNLMGNEIFPGLARQSLTLEAAETALRQLAQDVGIDVKTFAELQRVVYFATYGTHQINYFYSRPISVTRDSFRSSILLHEKLMELF